MNQDANILDFPAPDTPEQAPPAKDPPRHLTRGERLVGLGPRPSGDTAVDIARVRASRTIDALLNLPLHVIALPGDANKTLQYVDLDHKMMIEDAILRLISATDATIKALTWGK
ncbi:MAG TPA: hypothetical protein VK196_22275 [Magnetospirillum sp.]|nr:hypothetical protein [Magnetospirillum sp.]